MTYGQEEFEQDQMDRGRDRDDEEAAEDFRADVAMFEEEEWDARRDAVARSGYDS